MSNDSITEQAAGLCRMVRATGADQFIIEIPIADGPREGHGRYYISVVRMQPCPYAAHTPEWTAWHNPPPESGG